MPKGSPGVPRKKTGVCPAGHDKKIVGVYGNGSCRVCAKKKNEECRRARAVKKAGRPMPAVCEACSNPPESRGLHFDHDHATGKFRGWLCHRCNTTLGLLKDSPAILLQLALYLEAHRAAKIG